MPPLGDGLGVGVADGVAVAEGVGVGVRGVGVGVGVGVAVGLGVGVGVCLCGGLALASVVSDLEHPANSKSKTQNRFFTVLVAPKRLQAVAVG